MSSIAILRYIKSLRTVRIIRVANVGPLGSVPTLLAQVRKCTTTDWLTMSGIKEKSCIGDRATQSYADLTLLLTRAVRKMP